MVLEHVFPAVMHNHLIKLSASGQELGSDILFGQRVGFSGTPSDLLPRAVFPCGFESGSEGRIIHTLTTPDIVSVVETGDWTVEKLLKYVATRDPPFNTLIDTGALVTGMSNREVAEFLLKVR